MSKLPAEPILPLVTPTASAPPVVQLEDLTEDELDFLKSVPAVTVQAVMAFRRDLPELLRDHAGKWIAYTGDRRFGKPEADKTFVWQQCLAAGLTDWDFEVFWIGLYSAKVIHDAEV